MASEQFVLEMHKKLHPDQDINDVEELTGHEVNVIAGIVNDKHAITLSSHWIPDNVKVDMVVLRNVLTSASLSCYNKLQELDAQTVRDMSDGLGRIDPDMVTKWEDEVAYYQNQLDAIKVIEEQLLDVLTDATNVDGFYMRGVK